MSIVYSGSWSCENGTTIIITNKHPGQGERGNTKISTSTTAGRLSLNEQEPLSGLRAQKDKLASGMVPAIVAVCFCLFGHLGHGPDPILSILQLSLEHSRIIPVDNIIIIDATRLRAMIKQRPERRAVMRTEYVCLCVYAQVQSQYSRGLKKCLSFSFLFSSSSLHLLSFSPKRVGG